MDDSLLTTLLTALLSIYHTRNLLTCLLTSTAGVLGDPSPVARLVTGLSLMEDLAILCNADDSAIMDIFRNQGF